MYFISPHTVPRPDAARRTLHRASRLPRASSSSSPRRVVGRRARSVSTTLAASNAPGNAFAKFVSERFNNKSPSPSPSPSPRARLGPTNEIIDVVEGIARKRLGGTDIVVSEMALGTHVDGADGVHSPTGPRAKS